jgi:hypothetical protein
VFGRECIKGNTAVRVSLPESAYKPYLSYLDLPWLAVTQRPIRLAGKRYELKVAESAEE